MLEVRSAIVALAICCGTHSTALAASAGDLAMLLGALTLVYDAAGIVEEMKDADGRAPKMSGPDGLSRARYGDTRISDMLRDPWGTPFHIESDPVRGYLIVAAGSDRKFDRSTWSERAATRSTAEDVVFRDGALVRSPVEWIMVAAKEAAGDPVQQVERALVLSRHRRTVADLRMIALAAEAYQLDHGALPAAKNIDELADALEPRYIRNAPRTDAWDRPLHVTINRDGKSLTIVSRGADGKLDPADSSDDIVLRDSEVIRNAEAPPAPRAAAVDDDLQKARATTQLFEQLQNAIELYEEDHMRPPPVSSIDELSRALVPAYLDSAPLTDGWGTPLQVRMDGPKVQIISAGADRKFQPSRWSEPFVSADYERDLVLSGGMIENPWDTTDPADRLAQALGNFIHMRAQFEARR